MRFILFLLFLFMLGCVLYGISAGVRVIVRSMTSLGNAPAHTPAASRASADMKPISSPAITCLKELQALFRLHQQGALSREEFQQFKKVLLLDLESSVQSGKEPA